MRNEILWKKIVIFRQSRIGDALVTFPLIEALKHSYPGAELWYCTQKFANNAHLQGYQVVGMSPHIKNIVTYEFNSNPVNKFFELKSKLKIGRNDLLIYLPYSKVSKVQIIRDWLIFRFLGYRHTACFKENWRWTHIYKKADTKFPKESERMINFVLSSGISLKYDCEYSLLYDKEFADRAWDKWGLNDKKVLAICPGSRMQSKRWPKEKYIELGKEWHKKTGMHIVLVGGLNEAELANEVLTHWKGYGYTACGVELTQTAGILSKTLAYCGNDTGCMHLASLLKIPCVALFSARESKELWHPMGNNNVVLRKRVECENCGLENCSYGIPKCLEKICVEEVITALGKVCI